jgi:hypothetical protein
LMLILMLFMSDLAGLVVTAEVLAITAYLPWLG